MLQLKQAGTIPKMHALNNKVSKNMKTMIREEHRMQMELEPPGCDRHNTVEVIIQNLNSHLLSVLAGVADNFPMQVWDRLLSQVEVTIALLQQFNVTPLVSA